MAYIRRPTRHSQSDIAIHDLYDGELDGSVIVLIDKMIVSGILFAMSVVSNLLSITITVLPQSAIQMLHWGKLTQILREGV